MSPRAKAETLTGRLQQLLFSPKGGIEGMLIQLDATLVQVSMEPRTADVGALNEAIGKPIAVNALTDHSPKTKHGVHPVYQLVNITRLAGRTFKAAKDTPPVRGVVATIHYAKHGEPNGVILKSGEFIHTRPHGMKKLKLAIGSKVVARGERRVTVLGTALIEAEAVNRVTIE
jgi:hypothetical protein